MFSKDVLWLSSAHEVHFRLTIVSAQPYPYHVTSHVLSVFFNGHGGYKADLTEIPRQMFGVCPLRVGPVRGELSRAGQVCGQTTQWRLVQHQLKRCADRPLGACGL